MMRVLLFGSTGQVAQALAQAAWPPETDLTFLDRARADLSRPDQLGAIVQSHEPDVVIVAAAYTNVDGAEKEEELATTINAVAPATIARQAADMSVPIVYFSTDYVFDGKKSGYYHEEDQVGPLNAYGRSKLAGEIGVQSANPRHLILRTSWVYSPTGKSFLGTMLKLAQSRDEIGVVADQRGCPTGASEIAKAIVRILPAIVEKNGPSGTYHLAGASETTWHGFAEAIFQEIAERGHRRPLNRPIATAQYPTPAQRPKNSRLSRARFAREFEIELPGFEVSLPQIIEAALRGTGAPARVGS
jgi:dTDP-4-dehydrorhamnose reductase